jgi:hypothetical protein
LEDEFIELDRTFRELSINENKSDEFDLRRLRYGKSLAWADLTARHRTILLSEAGSGKTEEVRHTAQALRAEGKPAFFLRLEHIADHFDIAFEEGTLAEFEQWLASDRDGWLFLDSVDEARLKSPRDFEIAVRIIGAKINVALQRTHILITSRGSAWRPITDLKLCEQHLGYVPPKDPEKQEDRSPADKKESFFKIVALDDLGERETRKFAAARNVTNIDAFVKALEKNDAWSMAARPDDLAELLDFWKQNTRIGNRLELMQSSIKRRLTERDQTRAEVLPFSYEDALTGARIVAAAATMAQESAIQVPDGNHNDQGINVLEVLPGWDDKKSAALLARPIFDEAIYRTVRFHHRTVREYLTAEWFKELLDRQTTRRSIEAIFFRRQYGIEIIVPSMRPVLGWLILLDEKIRERALAISPELVFEGGEPKALPVELRIQILRETCEKMKAGIARSSASDYRAVQRFADHDIAEEIRALLAQYAANEEVRSFLLRMVWQGELKDAASDVKAIALAPSARPAVRISAIRAIKAVGTDTDNQAVRDRFLDEARTLDRQWFAELLDELPPTAENLRWVLACLAKIAPKKQHAVDYVPNPLARFVQSLELDLIPELLDGLFALIVKRPVIERRFCEISSRYGWLLRCAAIAVENLIAARHPAALSEAAVGTIQRIPAGEHYQDYDLRNFKTSLPQTVPAWRELNDALFWYDVDRARHRQSGKKLTSLWQISLFGSYWNFTPDDFDRALSYVDSRTRGDEKLVALSLAFHLYVKAQRPTKWRSKLRAVAKTPALRTMLQTLFNPPPATEEQKNGRSSMPLISGAMPQEKRPASKMKRKLESCLKQT